MSGGSKNVHLALMKKNAETAYTWLFVYQRAFSNEEGMYVGPGSNTAMDDANKHLIISTGLFF